MEPTPAQQSTLPPKKGFSLTFQIIITTILVILGYATVFFIVSLSTPKPGYCDICGLGLLALVIWDIISGIPLIFITIILIVVASNKLKSKPGTSKSIAVIYLLIPIICLILFIPVLLSNFQNYIFLLIFLPLLIYDWLFIKIYLESKKSIKLAVLSQVSAGKKDTGKSLLIIPFEHFYYFLSFIFLISITPSILTASEGHFIGWLGLPGLVLAMNFFIIANKFKNYPKWASKQILLTLIIFAAFDIIFILAFIARLLEGNQSEIIFWLLILQVFIFFMVFSFFKLKKEIKIARENSGNSSPTVGQNQSATTQPPNSDPRFPTLNPQPKPKNELPDN